MENGMKNLGLLPMDEGRKGPPLSESQMKAFLKATEPRIRQIQVDYLDGKIDLETLSEMTKGIYKEELEKITPNE